MIMALTCGSGGIRTPGTSRYFRFQAVADHHGSGRLRSSDVQRRSGTSGWTGSRCCRGCSQPGCSLCPSPRPSWPPRGPGRTCELGTISTPVPAWPSSPAADLRTVAGAGDEMREAGLMRSAQAMATEANEEGYLRFPSVVTLCRSRGGRPTSRLARHRACRTLPWWTPWPSVLDCVPRACNRSTPLRSGL